MTVPATLLLQRLSDGDESAAAELLPLVHDELHRLARHHMAGERAEHTLQPTALVHEAWMRLVGGQGTEWEGRQHFLRVASRAMRNVLVDHARARRAERRGGDRGREPFDAAVELYEEGGVDLVALSDALEQLEGVDPELLRIVEMRFFGGLQNREVAEALGTSLRSVERGWATARAWLRGALDDPPAG